MRRTARVRVTVKEAAAAAAASASSTSSSPVLTGAQATLALDREQRKWASSPGSLVVGIDEAGRGPLCGPVVAAAFAFLDPNAAPVAGVTDSKKLDEPTRERLHDELTSHPGFAWGVASVDEKEIDRINILQAAMKAMSLALENLHERLAARKDSRRAGFVYIDGNRIPTEIEAAVRAGTITQGCEAVIGGDAKVYSIAAASIIAKVVRDRQMLELDRQYPQYGFAQHKGYGVAAHMAAIHKFGPCPVHRRTFAPIKHMVAAEAAAETTSASSASSSAPLTTSALSSTSASSSSAGDSAAGVHASASSEGRKTAKRARSSAAGAEGVLARTAAVPVASAERKRSKKA